MPNATGADIEELEYLQELMRLSGWRIVKGLLNKHRIHCLEKSHECLRKHEDRKAGEWLAKSTEPRTLIELVENRKKELSDLIEKGSDR